VYFWLRFIVTSFDFISWRAPCKTADCPMSFTNRRGFYQIISQAIEIV
jgi:hypothetical protein